MAKRIIWSLRAHEDRIKILKYWKLRTLSNTYPEKLNKQFLESIQIIKKHPKIGKLTDNKNARIKIVKDYLIIYEEKKDAIHLLTIWDSRQNPEKLDEIV
jgi:plasmid stabilization system protein ParE